MKVIYITDQLHQQLKIRAIHNSESLQSTTNQILTDGLKAD